MYDLKIYKNINNRKLLVYFLNLNKKKFSLKKIV